MDLSREDMVAEGRRTDEAEGMMQSARQSTDGETASPGGIAPDPGARNQATAPPGNGRLDEPALAEGLDRLEQAGGGH